MTKLLILDKNGTLVETKSGETFIQHPEDQVLIAGVYEKLKQYSESGWIVAIASNQGGVKAGYKTIEDAKLEMMYCMKLTMPYIELGLFCPDEGNTFFHNGIYKSLIYPPHREFVEDIYGLSNCRKPNPGMLEFAKYYFESGAYAFPSSRYGRVITFSEILYVGDREEDRMAAMNAQIPFMWANDWLKEGIYENLS